MGAGAITGTLHLDVCECLAGNVSGGRALVDIALL